MKRRIPPDAFTAYCALGTERSYQAIADKYGVSKRAVARVAAKESWSARLAKIEREAQEKADRRVAETLDDMNERHLRIAKALQAKALKALTEMPLQDARDVIRALDLGVRQERLVRGEPTERQASVEEITKRELSRWLCVEDVPETDAVELASEAKL